MASINFDPKLFNPNFHWINQCINDRSLRYIFLYGGSSSGKTYSLVQSVVLNTLMDGKNSIIFRKVQASIKKTIYQDFKQVISTLQLDDYFDVQDFCIKCKTNKAIISFLGLDDPEKIKGISTYKRIIFDEVTEGTLDDFKQLRKRMRGIEGQQLICTFNPVDESHWLKQNIYDQLTLKEINPVINNNILTKVGQVERCDNYIFIKTTYLNNYWVVGSPCGRYGYLDEHTINDFEKDKIADYKFYRIYALGEWGKLSEGNEYYKNFDRNIHVGSFDVDEDLPLHISFDENLVPFLPLTISQVEDNYIKVCTEICGKNPNNNIQSVLRLFAEKYKSFKNNKIYVYGDSTSRKGDARTEKGYNLFGIIKTTLEEEYGFKYVEVKAPMSNPSVSMSGNFMNRVLSSVYPMKILIDSSCTNTITDFLYLKEDKDGGILKERVRNKKEGTSYEKYGHCSDSVRYFVLVYMQKEYLEFINRGKTTFEEINITFDDEIIAF